MNIVKAYGAFAGVVIVGVASPLIYNSFYFKEFKPKTNDLSDKTVVISGATSGIGNATAREFMRLRARVIMLCRDEVKCIEMRKSLLTWCKNGQVFCSKVDLESLESVKDCAKRLNDKLDKIDILVNCAGVMRIPKKTLTIDGLENHMAVNHYSHFVLTNLLLDKMKLSDDPRVLNITCLDYRHGKIDFNDLNLLRHYTPVDGYNQSKLANVLFSKELANKTKDTNIQVFSVRANRCHTELHRNLSYYPFYTLSFFPRMFHYFFEAPLNMIIHTIMYAALDPSLKDKSKTGICINNCKEEDCRLPKDFLIDAKKLWLVSEKWTRLDELRKSMK